MADVRINRLEIRLKGISFGDARSLADALGNELLRQLADQRDMLTNRRSVRLERITPGTFRVSGDQRVPDLQRTIAGSIVRSIASQALKSPRTRGPESERVNGEDTV